MGWRNGYKRGNAIVPAQLDLMKISILSTPRFLIYVKTKLMTMRTSRQSNHRYLNREGTAHILAFRVHTYLATMKVHDTSRYPQTEAAPSTRLKLLWTELYDILEEPLLILSANTSSTVSHNHYEMAIEIAIGRI